MARRATRGTVPPGRSPPTSGNSKSSSQSRSRSPMSVSVSPLASGPREVCCIGTSAWASASVVASTDHQRRCSSTRRCSSASTSPASGSACSSTPWTSEPKVAPAGRSAIGEGTSAPDGTDSSIPVVGSRSSSAWSSSTVPGTSGSASTAEVTSCSSARISPEYDVRRQSVSMLRTNWRTSSRPVSSPRGSTGAGPTSACLEGQRSGLLPLGERGERLEVTRHGHPVGHRRLSGRPAEQQPAEARVGGVLAGSPPGHHLGLGSGERHVGEPQLLARVLGPRATGRVGRAGQVEATGALVVVEQLLGGVGCVAVEEVRQVDDGVLQALAAVDGEDLHGRGVGVETPGAFGGGEGVATLLAEPLEQGRQPEALAAGGLVQQLAEVVEVGQQPLAVGLCEHASGQAGRAQRPRGPRPHRGCGTGRASCAPAPRRCRPARPRRRRGKRVSPRRTR